MTEFSNTLADRLARLEAIEAIKQLKARYLSACDRKQVEIIRDCFVDGPVLIDYGPIGRFEHREGLIEIFNQLGNHDYIIDMHHGQNPQIDILSSTQARATWQLYFHQINRQEKLVTQLGAFYDDDYVRIDGKWRISTTICTVTSQLVTPLSE
ncbi:nuclear transport factor 2 family protein [Aestuariicella hydrocarbonica]|uniref:Nuclear transport factor 2 family protein n=1 Tax=Pseudomaricurvus hydrocarbonicus TaxID=1470433 RepID=A0A9E5MHL1_9GAMM|nr:nuclear transport factor 2 family protein [Aestuariicella hydrocarbonica]NHO66066.1 nuclear transport factor 2 family protein [Aestuariicella hydrocarbonica]